MKKKDKKKTHSLTKAWGLTNAILISEENKIPLKPDNKADIKPNKRNEKKIEFYRKMSSNVI